MLNILSLVLLVGILPPKAKDEFEDGAWCRKMDQDLNVADGKIKGVKDTSWTLKKRDANGKLISSTEVGSFGMEEYFYSPEYKPISHIWEYSEYGMMRADAGAGFEKFIYDDHQNLLRDESRNLDGKLIGWTDYQYDSNGRLVGYVRESHRLLKRSIQTAAYAYDATGKTFSYQDIDYQENGDIDRDSKWVVKYDLKDRTISSEIFLRSLPETEYRTVNLHTNEYNDATDAPYYVKETTYEKDFEFPFSFSNLRDRRNRILETTIDGNGQHIVSKYKWVDTYDDQHRLISESQLNAHSSNHQAIITIDYQYRPQGIERVFWRHFAGVDKIDSANQQTYSYCD